MLAIFIPALSLLPFLACAGLSSCEASSYCAASSAHTSSVPPPLAGLTRSVVEPFRYALLTPESRVYASAPPGWTGPVSAAVVVTPALGAHFAMYLVNASAGSSSPLATGFVGAPEKLERLLYVLHGIVLLSAKDGSEQRLGQGGYVYYAPGDEQSITTVGEGGAGFVLLDREYAGSGVPLSVVGDEAEVEEEICAGEVFKLRRLLDSGDSALDFNVHIMDFAPGEYLNVKEVHYNQHGLLLLRGHGIYMLGERFFPVTAGDVIYMAPFVPQWYAALGSEPTRYFLYKDTNVNPLKK